MDENNQKPNSPFNPCGPAEEETGRKKEPEMMPQQMQFSEENFSDYVEYFKDWLYKNNPFYLISVFLIFWGLYLVSVDNTGRGPGSLKTLVLFYGIQNIYELLMLAMALYLMLKKINMSHGKLLLFFIFLFLVDATMYQAAIANACGPSDKTTWVGIAVSSLYLFFAIIKLGLVVHLLKITPRVSMAVYALAAFAIIYFSRHYSSYLITLNTPDVRFFGWWELYAIWLIAAIIQLPVILNSWWKPAFETDVENKYMGSENTFYTTLLIVPFIALPLQIALNIHPDLASKNSEIAAKLAYCYIPYIFLGAYFVETIWFKAMSEGLGLIDTFDFFAGFFALFFANVTRPLDVWIFGDTILYPHRLNLALIFGFVLFIALSRKNRMCLALLVMGALYYTRSYTARVMDLVYYVNDFMGGLLEKYRKLTTTARAIILIVSSFVFLGLGFMMSLIGASRDKKENQR